MQWSVKKSVAIATAALCVQGVRIGPSTSLAGGHDERYSVEVSANIDGPLSGIEIVTDKEYSNRFEVTLDEAEVAQLMDDLRAEVTLSASGAVALLKQMALNQKTSVTPQLTTLHRGLKKYEGVYVVSNVEVVSSSSSASDVEVGAGCPETKSEVSKSDGAVAGDGIQNERESSAEDGYILTDESGDREVEVGQPFGEVDEVAEAKKNIDEFWGWVQKVYGPKIREEFSTGAESDSEQDDVEIENDRQFPSFEDVTAITERFENKIGSSAERSAVLCRISLIWGENHVPLTSVESLQNFGDHWEPEDQFSFGFIAKYDIREVHWQDEQLVIPRNGQEVEEKFGKYFGYLARCEGKFWYIDPKN